MTRTIDANEYEFDGKSRRLFSINYLMSLLSKYDLYNTAHSDQDLTNTLIVREAERELQSMLQSSNMGQRKFLDIARQQTKTLAEHTVCTGLTLLKPGICLYLRKILLKKNEIFLAPRMLSIALLIYESDRIQNTDIQDFFKIVPIDLSSDIICEFEKDEDPYVWEVFSYANYLFHHFLPMLGAYIEYRFNGLNIGEIEEQVDGEKLIRFVDIYRSRFPDLVERMTERQKEDVAPFHELLLKFG